MRQIAIGKARPEYRRYLAEVAVHAREPVAASAVELETHLSEAHPSTPDPKDRVSKRQFDRALGDWRRRLHEFDAELDDARPSEGPLQPGEAFFKALKALKGCVRSHEPFVGASGKGSECEGCRDFKNIPREKRSFSRKVQKNQQKSIEITGFQEPQAFLRRLELCILALRPVLGSGDGVLPRHAVPPPTSPPTPQEKPTAPTQVG